MNKNTIEIIKALLTDTNENKEIKVNNPQGTKKQIVVLNRGWVVIGDYSENGDDCQLENASVIRTWGTTKGLGELAEDGVKSSTKLDPCPTVHFHKMTMVARMDVNMDKWK